MIVRHMLLTCQRIVKSIALLHSYKVLRRECQDVARILLVMRHVCVEQPVGVQGVRPVFGPRGWSLLKIRIRERVVNVRLVEEVVERSLIFRQLKQLLGLGHFDRIFLIIAPRGSQIQILLVLIWLGWLLRYAVVVVYLRPKPTLNIECTERAIDRLRLLQLLLAHQLALTPVNAHYVLLDASSQCIFFCAVFLVVWNAAFPLFFDDLVFTFEHFIILLFHFFNSEKKFLPEALIILLEQCVLSLHFKHVLLHFNICLLKLLDLINLSLQILNPELEILHHGVVLRAHHLDLLIPLLDLLLEVTYLRLVHLALVSLFHNLVLLILQELLDLFI